MRYRDTITQILMFASITTASATHLSSRENNAALALPNQPTLAQTTSNVLSSQHPTLLSLSDVINLARVSPSAKAAAAIARAADADKNRAEWALYPQLGISYSRNNSDNSQATVSAVASYLLFDGGRTRSNVREKDLTAQSESFNALEESDRMALGAVRAYLDAVRYEDLTDIARDNVKRHEQVAGLINEIVSVDHGRRADFALVQSRLAIAKKSQTSLEQQYKNARTAFEEITGVKPDGMMRPILTARQQADNNDESPYIERAEAYSPTLQAARKIYGATEARVAADKSWYIPDIHLQASKPLSIHGASLGVPNNSVIGITSTWNTTDRFSGISALQASRERMAGQADKIEALRRSIITSIREQMNLITSINERKGSAGTQRQSLKSVSDSYWDQFKIGRRTLLDALNTENDLFSSRIEESALGYDMLQAHFKLYALDGSLDQQVKYLNYSPGLCCTK